MVPTAPNLAELQHMIFFRTSMNNIFLALPCNTTSLAVAICFLFQLKLWKISDQPSYSSAPTTCLFLCNYDVVLKMWPTLMDSNIFKTRFPWDISNSLQPENYSSHIQLSLRIACCWWVSVLSCGLPNSERPLRFAIPSATEHICIRTDTLGKIFTLCSHLHLCAVSAK